MSHSHIHLHQNIETSTDEDLALLTYMLHHNEHHADELQELAQKLDNETSGLLQEAVSLFKQGNKKIEQALAMMHKEG